LNRTWCRRQVPGDSAEISKGTSNMITWAEIQDPENPSATHMTVL